MSNNFTASPTDYVEISDSFHVILTPTPYTLYSVTNPDILGDPSWSPDGTTVIFTQRTSGTWKIVTIGLGATVTDTVLLTSTHQFADPTYSADGNYILFNEQVGTVGPSTPFGSWRIRFMTKLGADVTTILDDGGSNMHPVWVTPTQIAFQSWNVGATPDFHINLIDITGTVRQDLGPGEYPRTVTFS